MATSVALKRGITAVTPLNRLFAPIRSVSAAPCLRRSFNTDSSQVSAYEDFNRSVDADRRPDSSVYRRRDNDFFLDLFDPISPTRSLSQILNMMDKFVDNPFMSASRGIGFGPRRSWDANENEETLSLRFDMPGLDKDNVKISVEQNTLIIKAEAEKESEDDDEPPRRYSSRIDLPMDVYKLEEIKAEMKNGVLKITVPKVKTEERKEVRQIQVE
ncbi:small heat shock protein, chloroplastic [Cynara cardunculus var. scolymus]|uniref:Alpha crystallin/Hsp20 domain-containing protein n=1 Tax=Cynara cardunculus var. scolymus TaxID=59895 RepID=A0A103XJQ1_CYNCS|nr:small heat shock protein, chloroplastic [Cynara cardunculus var. scolymus]KVH91948.1 Alpha crystallin/Hsp20 domain-containing protein [Cynara cardunculus var. scolymus]